ncbi:YopX family protein [Thermanaerosceptrum fracticalcis]|uniref:YopX family protein n=1 Tax=Thermanaerosceptrum fracticalcis TaxID=1712410 RepID=UPI00068999F2|nr:YopX family protein [Thermanaerosceptrum fracticalcis]
MLTKTSKKTRSNGRGGRIREIEFRGKRKDNGEWVYGYYYKDVEGTSILYLRPDGSLDRKKVIPKTVGQYIGLKDRHKKKIYKGDIIKVYDFLAIVEDDHITQMGNIKDFCFSFDTMAEIEKEIEIIGNIYENPELLNTAL